MSILFTVLVLRIYYDKRPVKAEEPPTEAEMIEASQRKTGYGALPEVTEERDQRRSNSANAVPSRHDGSTRGTLDLKPTCQGQPGGLDKHKSHTYPPDMMATRA